MMTRIQRVVWGVIFAALPSLALGLLAGIVFHDLWVALIVGLAIFGFGLDVLFGKGIECRQYKK